MSRRRVMFDAPGLDRRTRPYRDMLRWQRAIAEEVGGAAGLSVTQRTILESAARTKVLLDVVDAQLLTAEGAPDTHLLRERGALARALGQALAQLKPPRPRR